MWYWHEVDKYINGTGKRVHKYTQTYMFTWFVINIPFNSKGDGAEQLGIYVGSYKS